MKRIGSSIKRFLFPDKGSPRWLRVAPYIVLGVLTLISIQTAVIGWEYTNSSEFCGTSCHTMPPEYTAYLSSPHARVACVECHIGRGYISTKITRKAGDAKHIISLILKDYEYPITADELRPARETCELCHSPDKFSDDSLRVIQSYESNLENSPFSTYLLMKTGGGTKREGLGKGIHWHIENKVFFLSTDHAEQNIPYVKVINVDGSSVEYIDIDSGIDTANVDEAELTEMDCLTCHNRISHLVNPPEKIVDQLISRGFISPEIPDIRRLAVEVLDYDYNGSDDATVYITNLLSYYQTTYPDFYEENGTKVEQAVNALLDAHMQSVHPEQKSDWNAHPNNLGHVFSPGCFRCHDGKHLTTEDEAIRLECNLCHAIPVVADDKTFITNIELSTGPVPENHINSNWIALHRDIFDPTCANCHTVEDAGGTSNTSFCSNSACHGSSYEFAGFDAPSLRRILQSQIPDEPVLPTPLAEGVQITFNNTIKPLFDSVCTGCHGENSLGGLNLLSYSTLLSGGDSGPAIIPGDPENSVLILKQSGGTPHFANFSSSQLELIHTWIIEGAIEE